MQDVTRDLFVSIAVIGSIFGIAYLFFTTRHRERMSMLEKGVDPSSFVPKSYVASFTLKFGMFSVGIALGIITGSFLAERAEWLQRGSAHVAMVFLFGGLSLIANYLVDRPKR